MWEVEGGPDGSGVRSAAIADSVPLKHEMAISTHPRRLEGLDL
jgi:hypothetical protein